MSKVVAIDFEYSCGHLAHLKPVCCCLRIDSNEVEKWWLYNDHTSTSKFVDRIKGLINEGALFVAHAVELAEGRCFAELGIRDLNIKWWDTYLAEHLLHNCVKLGKSTDLSLLGCLKRAKLIADEDLPEVKAHKDKMRSIIIEDDEKKMIENKEDILDYCASDIHLLRGLMALQIDFSNRLDKKIGQGEIFVRPFGKDCRKKLDELSWAKAIVDYSHKAWLFALVDHNGIPLKKDEVEIFLKHSASGLYNLKQQFDSEVAHIYFFEQKKGVQTASAKRDLCQTFLNDVKTKHNITNWLKSDKTGLLSSRDEYLKSIEHIDERIKKFREHKKMCKAISSFTKDGEKNWLSSYDPTTSRVYPYHGFGQTQTFRNAHKGKSGFVPAWSKAMRTLQHPKDGYSLIACDFSSEEFILGMDLRHDEVGIRAYQDGDIYVATAKLMGLLPKDVPYDPKAMWNGQTMKSIRGQAKALVLGLGYGMGGKKLAERIGVSEDKAYELIASYKEIYHTMFGSIEQDQSYLTNPRASTLFVLPNGYNLLCRTFSQNEIDNDKGLVASYTRGMVNFPIQCGGAFILGEIVERCFKEGLKLVATIHDEIVVECKNEDVKSTVEKVKQVMVDSYEALAGTRNVRVSPEVWGGDVRCDHLEDGNKTYFGMLGLLNNSPSTTKDAYSFNDAEMYVDDFNDEAKPAGADSTSPSK